MNSFWDGFEKRAGVFGAIGGETERGRLSSKRSAERAGDLVADAADARKKNLGHYLLNPVVPGPLSEGLGRLSRRHHASMAERPVASSLIPAFGMIRGGKAGESKVK
jgi:hypothetical protein